MSEFSVSKGEKDGLPYLVASYYSYRRWYILGRQRSDVIFFHRAYHRRDWRSRTKIHATFDEQPEAQCQDRFSGRFKHPCRCNLILDRFARVHVRVDEIRRRYGFYDRRVIRPAWLCFWHTCGPRKQKHGTARHANAEQCFC